MTWRNCGEEAQKGAEKKRVPVWHTLGLVSRTCFRLSVATKACPRSRSGGKGVSYRYAARGGPGAFAKTSWARAASRRKNAGYVV